MYKDENLKVRVMLFYKELSRNETGFQNLSILPSRGHDDKQSLREGGDLLSLDGTRERDSSDRVTGLWDSVLAPLKTVILIVNIGAPTFLF